MDILVLSVWVAVALHFICRLEGTSAKQMISFATHSHGRILVCIIVVSQPTRWYLSRHTNCKLRYRKPAIVLKMGLVAMLMTTMHACVSVIRSRE